MNNYFERFNDIAILQLNTDGFEKLTEKQKYLTYYLSKAGLWGRYISLDQGSKYNIPLFNALIKLHTKLSSDEPLHKEVHDSLFTLFVHNGIYHSMSGEKLNLPLNQSTITEYKNRTQQNLEEIQIVETINFLENIPQFRTVQKDGVDVIQESGGNFYENLTLDEVNHFRKKHYPSVEGDEVPPFGFNQKITKLSNGDISCETISENGLYGPYVQEIIFNLTKALDYAENNEQYLSISTLIDFYRSGDAFDFDKHCIAWTKDKNSDVYFINGLIESYEDPLGIGCTFESIVAFKNPEATKKVNKIIENIQWFEDNLPFSKDFKKDKAVGLSASSISVISMAGDTSPTLPLGINLPNSDWIRKKHGSKSVNLSNVASSRSSYETQLREALFQPKYHNVLEKYMNLTNSLHTDLHEIAGHGSGKLLPNINTDVLGSFYSTIEEARADLVALYYISEPKLKQFGIYDSNVDVNDAALAQYVSYLTNGAYGQLRRVALGNDLTQAHFRNRQLIANWILENSDPQKISLIEDNGFPFIEISDINHAKEMFGKLLDKIQSIKSTGNIDEARELVMKYGTKVNVTLHEKLLTKIDKLDMPKVIGFITPTLEEHNNQIILNQSSDFFKQQVELFNDFNTLSIGKKNKLKP